METVVFDCLEKYVAELNVALKEGLGISFHNNAGLIARNPPGISIPDWDVIASFNALGECPVCLSNTGISVSCDGIEGPYFDNLFFIKNDRPFFGYRGKITMPRKILGAKVLSLDSRTVNMWDTEYGPIIGRLEADPNHIHDGRIQAYRFVSQRQLAIK